MRAFKITVALVLTVFCVGVTGLIYLQSEGAATAVGLLLVLVIVSFLYDHRQSIFTGESAPKKVLSDKAGTAVATAGAFTRLSEGEIRGTANYKGS